MALSNWGASSKMNQKNLSKSNFFLDFCHKIITLREHNRMEKQTQYQIFNQDNVELYSCACYVEALFNYHEMCQSFETCSHKSFSLFKKTGDKMELLKDSRQLTFSNI